MGCRSLTTLTGGKNLEWLGSKVFGGCEQLKSITIPGTVKEIKDETFWGCSSLVIVTLGSGLEKIGVDAFKECTKLKSIIIPASVKEIGDNAFKACVNLTILWQNWFICAVLCLNKIVFLLQFRII